ncbi:MAG: hypothetical protein HYZ81_00550, partial [Nitrospinae bacterium]|nr:hypothetical protein [Nitrospinota bacterium]
MPPLLMPICLGQTQRAWPKHPDALPVSYLPLHIALTKLFSTDAHLATYSVPTWPRRLSRTAVGHPQFPDGVPMVLAVFDVDCPASHKTPDPHEADARWGEEREKLGALHAHHPG